MQLNITGKNFEITDSLRAYAEKKAGRLERHLPNITDARMELSVENTRSAKDRQIAQMTLRTKQAILRAEEASADMFVSIDAVLEKMQRQINRYKGKRWARRSGGEASELAMPVEPEEELAEEVTRISRVKQFDMVPMDEEEAIDQMELLGHDFFVFYNVNQGQINVVYRRRNGDYGLIQPEMG